MVIFNKFLIKVCGGCPNTESLCRLSRTKLDSGLSERLTLYVSLFVEKNLVIVSCVFWQHLSDLFVSHILTTMQFVLVLATNFRGLCKTNTTGFLESLIFVTESAEAFLLQAIIVYKYQIWMKRQWVNFLSMPIYSIVVKSLFKIKIASCGDLHRLLKQPASVTWRLRRLQRAVLVKNEVREGWKWKENWHRRPAKKKWNGMYVSAQVEEG